MRKLSDRGVSEAIGFVIMFSLIVTGIGIVTLYGYPMLTEQRASSDEKAMERTMISVQNDMKLLTYSNIPYKDSVINVAGGTLTVHDSTSSIAPQFTISYTNTSGGLETFQFVPGDLQYTSDAGYGVITLQNGAVIKRQEQATGSYMISGPRWFIDTYGTQKTFIIFLMDIQADQLMASGGIGQLQMSRLESPDVIDESHAQMVKVEYKDDQNNELAAAWKTYFTQTLGLNDIGSDQYQTNFIDRIVIKKYTITVENL
jgi:hypothetical protein